MSLLLSVFIVDFEYVNVFRGALSCVNIVTQSLYRGADALFNIIEIAKFLKG